MKFELDEEQKTIKEAVREFAEKEIKPRGREFDKSGEFPFEILRKAARLGYIAVWIPEEYGGAGLGMLENAIIAEEFARADSGIGYAISLTAIGCPMVYRFGTEEQKEKYLPRIPKGESISFLAEPDAGSDVAAMKTVARKEGDEYVISGSKMFITNAKIADWGVVFAKTVPEAGHRGISAFIVETSTEGFEATPIEGGIVKILARVARRARPGEVVGEENRGFYHQSLRKPLTLRG